jgi:hypothetical protein
MLSLLRKPPLRVRADNGDRERARSTEGLRSSPDAFTDIQRTSLERASRELHAGFEELLKCSLTIGHPEGPQRRSMKWLAG